MQNPLGKIFLWKKIYVVANITAQLFTNYIDVGV